MTGLVVVVVVRGAAKGASESGPQGIHNTMQLDTRQQLRPGRKNQSAQWQNLWLSQKTKPLTGTETKAG